MVREAGVFSSEPRLVELIRLDERAHRAVDHEDPLGEQRREEGGPFLAGSAARGGFRRRRRRGRH
jgi:hypothetical protein